MEFSLSLETAASLQSILCQQDVHINSSDRFQESMRNEFEQVLPFYMALTEYVNANSKK